MTHLCVEGDERAATILAASNKCAYMHSGNSSIYNFFIPGIMPSQRHVLCSNMPKVNSIFALRVIH